MSDDVCLECNGSCRKMDCETCDNAGWVHDPSDGGTMTCPDCNGESGENCDACDGSGFELDEEEDMDEDFDDDDDLFDEDDDWDDDWDDDEDDDEDF